MRNIFIGFAIAALLCWVVSVFKPKQQTVIVSEINDLTTVVDSLKAENQRLADSVSQIDTVIIRINTHYEEETVRIINQSVSDDIEFFSNYLSNSTE